MNSIKNNPKRVMVIGGIVVTMVIALWLVPSNVLSPDGMLKKGEMYQKTGRTALALDVYKKAVKTFPDNYDARVHLGKAYLESDEPQMAKQEFSKAVELGGGHKNKYDAEIAMADMLIAEKQLEKAEKLLLSVDNPKADKVRSKLAELYNLWADQQFNSNRSLALEKYKKAYFNLIGLDNNKQQKIKNKVVEIYNDLAMDFIAQKKEDKALFTLKEAIKFSNNPSTHIRIAEIYRKQNKKDEAIAEYEQAYSIDTSGRSAIYLSDLLVDRGIELVTKNKLDDAKKNFEKAQEVNPGILVPAELLYSVAITDIKTNLTPNSYTDMVFPGVSFSLRNKSKDTIDFLKVKVVFSENDKEFAQVEKILISQQTPLLFNKTTENITVSSPRGVKNTKKTHKIQAKVYLSYNSEADWKIARALTLTKDKFKDTKVNNSLANINSINDKKLVASRANQSATPQKPKHSTGVVDPFAPQKGSIDNSANSGTPKPVTISGGLNKPSGKTAIAEKPVLAPLNPPEVSSNKPGPQPVSVPMQLPPAKKDVPLPPME